MNRINYYIFSYSLKKKKKWLTKPEIIEEEHSPNKQVCIGTSGNQPPWGCINTKEAICSSNKSLNSYLFKINITYIIRKF